MGYKREELEVPMLIMDNGSINNNLYFAQADDPAADEMLLSVFNGALMLVKQYQPNNVWRADSNTTEEVPTTSTKFLYVTLTSPDAAIADGDGSWMFSALVANTSNFERSLAIHLYHGTKLLETNSQSVVKDSELVVTFSGIISEACAAGDELSVQIQASGSGLELEGTDKVSSLIIQGKVDPTAASEINAAQGNRKKVPIVDVETTSNNPSRAEIEEALLGIGVDLPMKTAQTFLLRGNGRKWLCMWDEEDYLLKRMIVR